MVGVITVGAIVKVVRVTSCGNAFVIGSVVLQVLLKEVILNEDA